MARPSARHSQKDFEARINGYRLSQQELQVINLVWRGLSNNEIADMLVVSAHTVKTHVKNIFHKTGAKNRTELVYRVYGL